MKRTPALEVRGKSVTALPPWPLLFRQRRLFDKRCKFGSFERFFKTNIWDRLTSLVIDGRCLLTSFSQKSRPRI